MENGEDSDIIVSHRVKGTTELRGDCVRYILLSFLLIVACATVSSVDNVDNDYANSHVQSVITRVERTDQFKFLEYNSTVQRVIPLLREVSVNGVFARLYVNGEEEEGAYPFLVNNHTTKKGECTWMNVRLKYT